METSTPLLTAISDTVAAPEAPTMTPVAPADMKSAGFSPARLDAVILGVAGFIVLVTTALLLFVVVIQVQTYNSAIVSQLRAGRNVDHAAVLAYARATDFSAAKISALFLGFLLIFLGAMFVLRVAQASYALALSSDTKRQMAFSTSSPGLAMVTLGVLLVIVVLFTKSAIDYRAGTAAVPLYVTEDAAD